MDLEKLKSFYSVGEEEVSNTIVPAFCLDRKKLIEYRAQEKLFVYTKRFCFLSKH